MLFCQIAPNRPVLSLQEHFRPFVGNSRCDGNVHMIIREAAMTAQTYQHDSRTCAPAGKRAKLRPASHSYLSGHGEATVGMVVLSLCAVLVYTGVWLIRLLG